jgi:hypothetical protein
MYQRFSISKKMLKTTYFYIILLATVRISRIPYKCGSGFLTKRYGSGNTAHNTDYTLLQTDACLSQPFFSANSGLFENQYVMFVFEKNLTPARKKREAQYSITVGNNSFLCYAFLYAI